ncbi:hypothetical protein SAMN05660226_00624 [Parapedobacter luteus]|uniref:Uncharacterized protein n=1 Tax=Parapedobacter luteus TaxID=623280 RepID=A0A1T5A5X9_9SPHI|nr:hypothetical protein [Parapedobacter luteus]SKB30384.1 hypothetical protein SAMN05660226_00624 [Parapedobacter luteus]
MSCCQPPIKWEQIIAVAYMEVPGDFMGARLESRKECPEKRSISTFLKKETRYLADNGNPPQWG